MRAYDEAIRADASDARCWANRAAAQMAMLGDFGKGLSPAAMRRPAEVEAYGAKPWW